MGVQVLHINTLDVGGGAERIALDITLKSRFESTLIVKLKKSDFKQVIQLPRSWKDKIFHAINKGIYWIGFKKDIKDYLSISEKFNNTYRKLLDSQSFKKASIVHLHNIHGSYFDIDALLQIAKNKHLVWTLHDMWPLTGGEAYTFENEGFKRGIGKTPHNHFYPLNKPVVDRRQHYIERKRKIYAALGGKLTFVAVSNWMKNNIEESYTFSSENNIVKINNGIDINIFRNFDLRNWTIPRVLFFNSSSPFKGSKIFLEALKSLEKNFEINVIGEEFKDSRVRFHKQKIYNLKEMANVYNESDVLVFPSLADNLPLTILEGMACGVCVISSDVGGISEIIDNKNLLFQPGNIEELNQKLTQLIKNKITTNQNGKIAEQIVRERFNSHSMINRYDSLYTEILKNIKVDDMNKRISAIANDK